jgi:hypothetical protein
MLSIPALRGVRLSVNVFALVVNAPASAGSSLQGRRRERCDGDRADPDTTLFVRRPPERA